MKLVQLPPEQFLIALHRTKHQLKGVLGLNLTQYKAKDIPNARCFFARKERAGFAVNEDGELLNVFSIDQGLGDELIQRAVQEGATHLNCYAGYLEDVYTRNGFEIVERVAWDDQYAPKGWNKTFWGTPDVLFMRLK